MFRKSYFLFALIVATLTAGSSAAFGQYAAAGGRVEMADTKAPVVGAVIEVYRTDIKAGFPSTKTNKKGDFNFAGFMLGATYILSVSAPNCAPTYYPNVKAGQEKLVIALDPGDGRKYTEEEVRNAVKNAGKSTSSVTNDTSGKTGASTPSTTGTAVSGSDKGELTDEGKKQKAEYDAQVAAIEAKNKKALKNNEVISQALKDGNAAFDAKNYDLAISKYDEGIAADPDFVGSAPILLNNRGSVLKDRAVDIYNKNAKSTDATAKFQAFEKVKKDFEMSVESFNRAWTIAKNAPAAEIADPKTNEASQVVSIRGARETFRISVLTELVDPSVIEIAKVMIPEYLKIETDAVKKADTMLILADLYRVSSDSENAIAEYKKILTASPDNLDALVGVGLSLVNLGYVNDDKAMLQEAANYLQAFVSKAPATHKFKDNAVEAIDTLKKLSNVAPQKGAATPKKKN